MRDKAADRGSGWTVQSLKEHFDIIIATQDVRIRERWEANQIAVIKAETANEKRFDAANEFRGQLSDQARSFLPRREYQVQHDALVDRVILIEGRQLQQLGGDARAIDIRGVLIGISGLIVAATAVLTGVIVR